MVAIPDGTDSLAICQMVPAEALLTRRVWNLRYSPRSGNAHVDELAAEQTHQDAVYTVDDRNAGAIGTVDQRDAEQEVGDVHNDRDAHVDPRLAEPVEERLQAGGPDQARDLQKAPAQKRHAERNHRRIFVHQPKQIRRRHIGSRRHDDRRHHRQQLRVGRDSPGSLDIPGADATSGQRLRPDADRRQHAAERPQQDDADLQRRLPRG